MPVILKHPCMQAVQLSGELGHIHGPLSVHRTSQQQREHMGSSEWYLDMNLGGLKMRCWVSTGKSLLWYRIWLEKSPHVGRRNSWSLRQMEMARCTTKLYAKIHPEVSFKFVLVRQGALTPASHCWRKNPVFCSWPAPGVLTTAHWIREEGPRVWIFWFLKLLRWYHLRIYWEFSA